ncbi:MAG TPA: hypothetical protein VFB54_02915 [Burkholderiales bacterium]|nr:hypothetical protein [Burkholderiales bacterium]
MDTSKGKEDRQQHQAQGRHEPRHPDDVQAEGAQPGGARSGGARSGGARSGGARSGGARSGGATSEQRPQDVPDANPGREYQGIGIMNKYGRFGSSARPQDLENQDLKHEEKQDQEGRDEEQKK